MLQISKKVCLLGEYFVGKTSLVRRFVYDRFDDKYISTIGVKVSRKTVVVLQGTEWVEVTLMLWDMSGGEEFTQLRTSYLRGASGAILVADLTRPETFEALKDYLADLYAANRAAQMVLAANKSDLIEEQRFTPAQVEAFAEDLGVPFFLTSAKTGAEVETLFRCLGQLLLS